MEERLQYILTNVNDWLKFAESKNAALLAANVAVAFGLLSQFQARPNLPPWAIIYTCVVLGGFIVASVICLLSFVPKLQIPNRPPKNKVEARQNLIFYGHIADLSCHDYLAALYNRNGLDPSKMTDIEEDYAEQIVVNSGIALRKYKCFSVALILTMVTILAALIDVALILLIA